MKPAKTTKKKASAKAPKTTTANLEFVQEICDEAIATIMALNALVRTLSDEKEDRK